MDADARQQAAPADGAVVRLGRSIDRLEPHAAVERDARKDRDAVADEQAERVLAPAGWLRSDR